MPSLRSVARAIRHPQSTIKRIRNSRYQDTVATPVRAVGNTRSTNERERAIANLSNKRIAIQAHIFYDDLAPEIVSYLRNVPVDFDLFITTDTEDKATRIRDALTDIPHLENIEILAFGNRGRDVLPFIAQMKERIEDYDLIGHVHTKRSLHFDKGDEWRRYLLKNALGSEDVILDILTELSGNSSVGLIYPQTFEPIIPFMEWGSNRDIAKRMLDTIELDVGLPDEIIFPAGDMFWARTDAVSELFDERILELWDESTDSAENGTVMHAVERLWSYVANKNGYDTLLTNIIV